MSFKDWISYLLERMIWFMETPRTERKALRRERREPWGFRWFGVIPYSIKLVLMKQLARLKSSRKKA